MVIIRRRPLISTQEEYLSAIDQLANPTFDAVRDLAVAYYMRMDEATRDAAIRAINGGKAVIDTIEQCRHIFIGSGEHILQT